MHTLHTTVQTRPRPRTHPLARELCARAHTNVHLRRRRRRRRRRRPAQPRRWAAVVCRALALLTLHAHARWACAPARRGGYRGAALRQTPPARRRRRRRRRSFVWRRVANERGGHARGWAARLLPAAPVLVGKRALPSRGPPDPVTPTLTAPARTQRPLRAAATGRALTQRPTVPCRCLPVCSAACVRRAYRKVPAAVGVSCALRRTTALPTPSHSCLRVSRCITLNGRIGGKRAACGRVLGLLDSRRGRRPPPTSRRRVCVPPPPTPLRTAAAIDASARRRRRRRLGAPPTPPTPRRTADASAHRRRRRRLGAPTPRRADAAAADASARRCGAAAVSL
jgi:hypothetical protein